VVRLIYARELNCTLEARQASIHPAWQIHMGWSWLMVAIKICIAIEIVYFFHITACKCRVIIIKPAEASTFIAKWMTPSEGIYKVNWDVAIDCLKRWTGVGIIDRDSEGNVIDL
jgi:hypothetical protein